MANSVAVLAGNSNLDSVRALGREGVAHIRFRARLGGPNILRSHAAASEPPSLLEVRDTSWVVSSVGYSQRDLSA